MRISRRLSVHETPGPGPRVLWIHGYTMDHTVFAPIWAALPDWLHVGVDLPGHGATAAFGPAETLQSLVDDLAAVAL